MSSQDEIYQLLNEMYDKDLFKDGITGALIGAKLKKRFGIVKGQKVSDYIKKNTKYSTISQLLSSWAEENSYTIECKKSGADTKYVIRYSSNASINSSAFSDMEKSELIKEIASLKKKIEHLLEENKTLKQNTLVKVTTSNGIEHVDSYGLFGQINDDY